MQHRGNLLIGLRTNTENNSMSESDSDVFDSDGLNDGVLRIRHFMPAPLKIESKPGLIKNFNEITPYLPSILSNLENYTIPTIFTSEVCFIPKNIVPDDLSHALLEFSKDVNSEQSNNLYNFIINYNSNNFPNAVLAQIELIKFIKTGEKSGLVKYTNMKLDSRILSLLHFALTNKQTESNIERQSDLYHEVISLQEYVKYPTPAPLSALFPHFTIPEIIYRLCWDLIKEFPSNPFLESVLTSFQPYCPKVEELISIISSDNDNRTCLIRSNPVEYRDNVPFGIKIPSLENETEGEKKVKRKKRLSQSVKLLKLPENLGETNSSKESLITIDTVKSENEPKSSLDEFGDNDDDEYDINDVSEGQNLSLTVNTTAKLSQEQLALQDMSDDDLSNDSFFAQVREARQKGNEALINLKPIETVENPLDMESKPSNRYENVTLREPPQMSTFLFVDGTDRMNPKTFENWIFSIRCDRPEVIKNSSSQQTQPPGSVGFDDKSTHGKSRPPYKSNPISTSVGQSDEGSQDEESADFYFSLLSNLDDQFTIQKLPSSISPPFYSLYLPIFHTLCMNNENIKMKSAVYPKMLAYEREAHMGLRHDDKARAQRTLAYFKERIEEINLESFDLAEPRRLDFDSKRKQPLLTPDIPDTFVAVLAVIDYELIIHSRSPLSLEYYTVQFENINDQSLICNPHWRASFLFSQYTNHEFSPYICFRIAFALAVNLADKNADLSCSFAFEALYVFLSNVPFVRKLPCIRSVLLFFGEMLEKLNRYYYAAQVLDNFFLSDIRNASYSSKIAQMAAKNNDVVRAVFHYNQSLKSFISHGYVDQALYIGQVIASIYVENSFFSLAISLLTYLLYISYDIPVGKKREKMDAAALGSLRIPRSRIHILSSVFSDFKPSRTWMPTILTATMLSRLLGKANFFKQAKDLIGQVIESSNSSMKKMLGFTQAYISYQQNDMHELISIAPTIELPKYITNAPILNFISNLNIPKNPSISSSFSSEKLQKVGNRNRSNTVARIGKVGSSSYFGLRPSLSSHFSILSFINFDPNTATLRLLARAFIERGQFRQAFLYSELFIHCCSIRNIKELGCGFFYRGLALMTAAYNCQYQVNLFEVSTNEKPYYNASQTNLSSASSYTLSKEENSKEKIKEKKEKDKEKKNKEKDKDPKILQHDKMRFPQLPFELCYDSNKMYSKNELIELAFISLCAARSCFARVTSTNKIALTSLLILNLLVFYPETLKKSMIELNEPAKESRDTKNKKREKFSSDDEENPIDMNNIELNNTIIKMRMKPPVLLTNFPNFSSPSFESVIDNTFDFVVKDRETNQYSEEIDDLMLKTEQLTNRILDPLYVIHLEILSSIHNFNKGNKEIAQTKFDYAFTNFQKLFVCGYHLIPIDLSIKKLLYIKFLLENMCLSLTKFDSSFINDRLLAFDIYNDTSCVLKNRLRNIEPRNLQPIEPSIELSPLIIELENPKLPSFVPILQSNGFIDDSSRQYSENLGISECLDFISANIKLCTKEKITVEEMSNRNKNINMSIANIAEKTRRQNSSQLPPDTTFSFLQRCKPEVQGAIYIQRLFNTIVIYIPSTGYIRRVEYPYPQQTIQTQQQSENDPENEIIYGGGNGYDYDGSCLKSTDDGDGIVNVVIEEKTSYEFNCDLRNCLFSGKFIEFCLSLLLYNDTKKVQKAMTIQSTLLSSAAKSLFGKDLLNRIETLSWINTQKKSNQKRKSLGSVLKISKKESKGIIPTVRWEKSQDLDLNLNEEIFNPPANGEMKLIFIASHDMEFIPFEVFFTNCSTIRCPFLMQMMLMTTNRVAQTGISHIIMIMKKEVKTSSSSNSDNEPESKTDEDSSSDNKFAANNLGCIYESGNQQFYGYDFDDHSILTQQSQALQRTKELINDMFTSFGSGDNEIAFVDGFERLSCFPFKDSDFKKLSFCDFVDLLPNEFPKTQNASSSLFLFSYSDLCEMPALVNRVLSDYPFSFFLFIPASLMKDALKIMKKKFSAEKKKSSDSLPDDYSNLKSSLMNVVLDLQMDLQSKLMPKQLVPIPLVSYLH